jgi:hypothetical protein
MSTLTLISLLVLAAVHVAGLVVLIWSAAKAPLGYEDVDGFHVISRPQAPRRLAGDPAELDWEIEGKRAA